MNKVKEIVWIFLKDENYEYVRYPFYIFISLCIWFLARTREIPYGDVFAYTIVLWIYILIINALAKGEFFEHEE